MYSISQPFYRFCECKSGAFQSEPNYWILEVIPCRVYAALTFAFDLHVYKESSICSLSNLPGSVHRRMQFLWTGHMQMLSRKPCHKIIKS